MVARQGSHKGCPYETEKNRSIRAKIRRGDLYGRPKQGSHKGCPYGYSR